MVRSSSRSSPTATALSILSPTITPKTPEEAASSLYKDDKEGGSAKTFVVFTQNQIR
jgi:hypothetical protein